MSTFGSAAASDFSLLVDHTLAKFHRRPKFETVLDQSDGYPFLDRIFPAHKMRQQSGENCEFRFVLDGNNSFRWTALFQPRGQRDYSQSILKGTVAWANCDYEVYIHQPTFDRCRDEAAIIGYLEEVTFAGKKSAVEGLEPSFMQAPADADDTLFPKTIPCWILGVTSGVENYDGGFIGQNAYYEDGTVYTNGAGSLARDTESRFRNWAANHNGVWDAQLLSAIRKGRIMRGYKTPSMLRGQVSDRAPKTQLVVSQFMQSEYEDLVATRFSDGENKDVSPQGTGGFRVLNEEMLPCATLNDDALKSVYDIDWSYIHPITLRDRWHKALPTIEDHDLDEMFIKRYKCSWQMLCDNPRRAGAKYHMPRT